MFYWTHQYIISNAQFPFSLLLLCQYILCIKNVFLIYVSGSGLVYLTWSNILHSFFPLLKVLSRVHTVLVRKWKACITISLLHANPLQVCARPLSASCLLMSTVASAEFN